MIKLLARKHSRELLEYIAKDRKSKRWSMITKNIPVTARTLSSILKDMENFGLIVRNQLQKIPPHVEYVITEKGLKMVELYVNLK